MENLTPEMELWMAATFLNAKIEFKYPPISLIMGWLSTVPSDLRNRACVAYIEQRKSANFSDLIP
jgi:hypothetical protein